MKLIIAGSEESGMPEGMSNNLERLLEQRFVEIPEVDEEIVVLYSEKDPLMDKGLWDNDDEAYTIEFTVISVEPTNEQDLDKITITVELNF